MLLRLHYVSSGCLWNFFYWARRLLGIYTTPTLKIVKTTSISSTIGRYLFIRKYMTFFLQSKTPLAQGTPIIDLLEDSRSRPHFLIKWIMHQLQLRLCIFKDCDALLHGGTSCSKYEIFSNISEWDLFLLERSTGHTSWQLKLCNSLTNFPRA